MRIRGRPGNPESRDGLEFDVKMLNARDGERLHVPLRVAFLSDAQIESQAARNESYRERRVPDS